MRADIHDGETHACDMLMRMRSHCCAPPAGATHGSGVPGGRGAGDSDAGGAVVVGTAQRTPLRHYKNACAPPPPLTCPVCSDGATKGVRWGRRCDWMEVKRSWAELRTTVLLDGL